MGLPFAGENLTSDSCRLTWYSPEDDGGSAITNYIIEKRESDRMGWTSVSYTVTRNNAVVQGLLDGKGYFFRIAAENIIGMGPFIETDRMVLIKDPICESHTRRSGKSFLAELKLITESRRSGLSSSHLSYPLYAESHWQSVL